MRNVIDTEFRQRGREGGREGQVERHLHCQGIGKEGGSERRRK
jgi:hypothetical protein